MRTEAVWLRYRQGPLDGIGPFGFLGGCQSTHGTPFQHLVLQGKGGGAGSDGTGLHPLDPTCLGLHQPLASVLRSPRPTPSVSSNPCVKPLRSWLDLVQPHTVGCTAHPDPVPPWSP